jgi:hypothetical protein
MSALRDQAARRRLDPLTTTIPVPPPQTPTSAYSNNPLSAQFGYHPQTWTPVSAVPQYNPQQWAASPGVHGDHGAQYARHDPESELQDKPD